MSKKVIEVTQKPIIAYSLLQKVSSEVSEKIASLNIDTLEPTEENLSVIKSTRAELSKDFKLLEEQRKMVKEIVLKDYNKFEDEYKKLIATPFKEADATLKGLVSEVDDEILSLKINGLKEYFDEVNTFDFVGFDELGLKIIKSKSDKSIKAEIDEYISNIKVSLDTIDTLPNKERVLAKFQMFKDLNRSISEVNVEMQREEQIKKDNEERELRIKLQKEQEKAAKQEHVQVPEEAVTHDEQPAVEASIDDQVYQASFKVFATKSQLRELKNFMQEKGIRYESN